MIIGGTAGAHLIALLASPLLTRLYNPEQFGLLAVFSGILSILGVNAGLRYQLAIPLPDSEHETNALFMLTLLVTAGVSILAAVPLCLYSVEIAGMLNVHQLASYLYLVPLGIFFIGLYHSLYVLLMKRKAYVPIAHSKIQQVAITLGIQVAGASHGVIALLAGQVGGHAAGSAPLLLRLAKSEWKGGVGVSFADMFRMAHRYRRFPKFETWSALFNAAGSQMPSLLLAALFGPAAAGIYALANRVLAAPMQLLGQSISDVFYPRAVEASRYGRLSDLAAQMHARLAQIVMPPTLILMFGGEKIFATVFGAQWALAGSFSEWLALWLYLVLITAPLSNVFLVLNRHGAGLIFEISNLGVRCLAILVGASLESLTAAIALLAIGSVACRAVMMIHLLRLSGNQWSQIWKPPLTALLWSLPLVSPVILSRISDVGDEWWYMTIAAASVLVAVRYLFILNQSRAQSV